MYSYNISKVADNAAFKKACNTIETTIKDYTKKAMLTDVDGSLIQVYETPNGKITVFNDYEVDAVYADSEVNLDKLNISNNW